MALEEHTGWYRWRPQNAESAAYEEIAEGVSTFEPVDNEAGHAGATWLKEASLLDYPSTATWLLYDGGRLHGYFAICSSSFQLRDGEQKDGIKKLLSRGESRREPCSEIIWFCRHRDSAFKGRSIFLQAAYVAQQVAAIQGNIAMVVNPYDDATAKLLQERYNFLRSTKQGALWYPLYTDAHLAS